MLVDKEEWAIELNKGRKDWVDKDEKEWRTLTFVLRRLKEENEVLDLDFFSYSHTSFSFF
jgi:hypothetical protein